MKKTKTMKKKVSTLSSKVVKNDDDYALLVVKIISILGYVGAGLGILMSLLLLFGGSFILGVLPLEGMPQLLGALAGAFIIVIAILLLAFSIFWIFVSRALWNHKNWARIVVIVFAVLGILGSLSTIPSGILSLLIDGAIVYFLGFDEKVKGLFK